ncbi:MAG: FAD binding domain-containing protein [Bauldia sp.]|nr:FAD binding domain-containing protein [Bauldia sp.]
MALEIVRVDSVRTEAAILAAESGARFLAGGTLLVRQVNEGDGSIDRLVLCDGLGLDQIAVDGGRVTLGAAVAMAKIAADPRLAFLKPVAGSIGGPAVRAMATVGGNLFAPYPYGDFTVALLALGADVTVESPDGVGTIDLEAFLNNRKNGAPTGVVRSVGFPVPPAGAFRFAKVVRRKPHGASVLSIAAVLPMAGRKVSGVRVAYGAMAPFAVRARAVEKALDGKLLDEAAIAAAIAVATEGCAPLSDPQASDWYRLSVLPVHLKRLLSA